MIKDLETTYIKCDVDGIFKVKEEVDTELIKSLKDNAERGIAFIRKASNDIPKESSEWTFVFREYYEALRLHIEAFLLFDRIDANNHQCKNAYVCFKHKGLGLDWEFLESVRLKRNAINYRGELLEYADWNPLKKKFEAHLKTLSEAIETKLKSQS